MFLVHESSIHGHGCFAECDITPGTIVRVPSYMTEYETYTSLCDDEDGVYHEFAAPFRFLNHNSEANAELYLTDHGFELYLIRHIKAGEEITIDYGEEPE